MTMSTVSGPVRSMNYAQGTFTLQSTHGTVTVAMASGARVQVHGLPANLQAVQVGMLAFAEGSPAGTGKVSAKLVQGFVLGHAQSVVTGIVSSVDAAGAQLVVEPGPYLRAVAFVPAGAKLTRGGKSVALSTVRPGAVVTVHGFADAMDSSEVVVTSASFQSATFTPDLSGTVASVDAAHRLLTVHTAAGSKLVSVPLTAPVLAGGEAFTLDGLQPGTGVRVAYVRDALGHVVRTASGQPVARIVADAQAAY